MSQDLELMLAEAKLKRELLDVKKDPSVQRQNTIIFGFLIKIAVLISALAGTLYWTIAWFFVGHAVFCQVMAISRRDMFEAIIRSVQKWHYLETIIYVVNLFAIAP